MDILNITLWINAVFLNIYKGRPLALNNRLKTTFQVVSILTG